MKFNILILTVSEAEKYRAEREQCTQIIEARNCLESFAYNLLNVIQVSFSVYYFGPVSLINLIFK
jgi:hypothetical protein